MMSYVKLSRINQRFYNVKYKFDINMDDIKIFIKERVYIH